MDFSSIRQSALSLCCRKVIFDEGAYHLDQWLVRGKTERAGVQRLEGRRPGADDCRDRLVLDAPDQP